MKNLFRKGISLILTLGLVLTTVPAVWADESSSGAAAPPAEFSVYVNVEGSSEPTLVRTYTATEMKLLAKQSKDNYINNEAYPKMTSTGAIYYTAASQYSLTCGRVVPEYVLISDLFDDLGVTFGDGDCFIMGTDYTNDSRYAEYNFGSNEENYKYWKSYGWYNSSDLTADRYYFQNWDSAKAMKVPAIIALRSYGGNDWSAETYWQMYASSSDYLWAYVVNFGQTDMSEATYNRFVYQNTECTLRFAAADAAETVIKDLLSELVKEAENELATTETGTDASEISEGSYWTTEASRIALENALESYGTVSDSATNSEAYGAYLSLSKAVDNFKNAKKAGTKTGYAWFSMADYETTDNYIIRTRTQLAELAELVSGTADLGEELAPACDFAGKTITLANDIDLDKNRIIIGDEKHPFRGTFDGSGHELTNLNILAESGYTALFAVNEGTIKDLTLDGSIHCAFESSESAPVGGIAALNKGTIEGCRNNVYVTSYFSAEVGGIAGRNEGVIDSCINTSAMICGLKNVGGIAGYMYANADSAVQCVIKNSLNGGGVYAIYDEEYDKAERKGNSNAGGIAGGIGADAGAAPLIESCINSAEIASGGKTLGGIAGGAWISEASIKNCYNTGKIYVVDDEGNELSEYPAEEYNLGAVAGRSKASVANCLWLGSTAEAGIGHDGASADVAGVSAAELIGSAAALGDAFKAVENGYPALTWQMVYQIGFDLGGLGFTDAHYAGEYLQCAEPEAPQISGYTFDGWYTSDDYSEAYDFAGLITSDTTIYGKLTKKSSGGGGSSGGSGGGGGSSSVTTYNVNTLQSDGGEVKANTSKAEAGNTVIITATPLTGYSAAGVTVTAASSGKAIEATKNSDGTYSFTMPSGAVNVAATFTQTGDTTAPADSDTVCAPYSDIDTSKWYHSAVHDALYDKLMTGTSSTAFTPNGRLTRAMLARILYNNAGQPAAATAANDFSDVKSGDWYASAVDWAAEKGVVKGYEDGTFRPDAYVTREELAAMLYRYAGSPAVNSNVTLSSFADAGKVAAYAQDAVKWAVSNSIITGSGNTYTLDPKGTASRAQAAAMIVRYLDTLV